MNAMIGKTIGRYRITEHLGRGGMAEVYKAHQASLDRDVAIKLMHGFLADEPGFLARFEREAKVVATLRHPNIVQVYDFDADHGVYYMVMEFINGETLKARLQTLETKGEWVPLDDAARIVLAVGSALKYAHERGMVHRDVKPANVMITTDGQVILTDFGIAKIVSASHLTASGALMGTPSYMAPEQGLGQPGDERSDIYSLGVMLYQLVVGRLPFDADTPLAVVLKHINEPLPLPYLFKPELPEALNAVILKALAKDPNKRYPKVGELLADLRRAMGLPADDPQAETAAAGSSIKLSSATQAASPQTVVASKSTVHPIRPAAAPPVKPKARRPGWIIPVVLIAVIALAAIGAVALNGTPVGGGTSKPPTPTPSITSTSAPTPTAPPLTAQLFSFKRDNVELHAKADPASQVQGLLRQATQFLLRARTADDAWLRIETPDGTSGWVEAGAIDLGGRPPRHSQAQTDEDASCAHRDESAHAGVVPREVRPTHARRLQLDRDGSTLCKRRRRSLHLRGAQS
jgi:serine/threonine protein kinase